MKQQTNENQFKNFMFHENGTKNINNNSIISMQRMIINTAPVGIKKRIGKNMIQVHQHRSQQYQPVLLPLRFIIPVSNCSYRDKMKKIMDEGLKHFGCGLSGVSCGLSV